MYQFAIIGSQKICELGNTELTKEKSLVKCIEIKTSALQYN